MKCVTVISDFFSQRIFIVTGRKLLIQYKINVRNNKKKGLEVAIKKIRNTQKFPVKRRELLSQMRIFVRKENIHHRKIISITIFL